MDRKLALLAALVSAAFLAGVAVGAVFLGRIKIQYSIETGQEPILSLSPNPIILDLGTIPSGTAAIKDLGNVSRLSLSVGYTLDFTLDLATLEHFNDFTAKIYIYIPGESLWEESIWLTDSTYGHSETVTLYQGDYDIHIILEYSAKKIPSNTTGEVTITISY